MAHVTGGLTSTITNLHGAENWSSTRWTAWASETWWTRTPLRWTPRCLRSARATKSKPRATANTKGRAWSERGGRGVGNGVILRVLVSKGEMAKNGHFFIFSSLKWSKKLKKNSWGRQARRLGETRHLDCLCWNPSRLSTEFTKRRFSRAAPPPSVATLQEWRS